MEKLKTVLLVDDDIDFIEQMKTAIQKEFAVVIAYDGEEAMRLVNEINPDLIVMDVMMKHMADGFDTAKKLKENDATKNIPIIMLTSVYEHYDYRTQINEDYYPRDKWIDKPVAPEKLLGEIKKLIA
jgi:DNA-binding response OmpR family regulator